MTKPQGQRSLVLVLTIALLGIVGLVRAQMLAMADPTISTLFSSLQLELDPDPASGCVEVTLMKDAAGSPYQVYCGVNAQHGDVEYYIGVTDTFMSLAGAEATSPGWRTLDTQGQGTLRNMPDRSRIFKTAQYAYSVLVRVRYVGGTTRLGIVSVTRTGQH